MKKSTLFEIILANIGGMFVATGLFMIFISSWNLRTAGIVSTVYGAINLLALILVRKKFESEKVSGWKSSLARLVMIVAALAIGSGTSQIMAQKDMVFGLIIWIAGLIFSTLSYPILEHIKKDREKIAKTIVGTVGCVLLLVGMSMTFIGYWNLIYSGTIVGLAGIICIIVFCYLNKKANSEFYSINITFIMLVIIEIFAAFITVYGIVRVASTNVMLENYHRIIIQGLVACAVGFIINALAVPTYIYLKSNHIGNKELKVDLKSKENEYPIRNLVYLFFVYGLCGWVIEFTFYGITNGIFVNRGFLHLPILPIYGFGGTIITLLFRKNQKHVFIKSAIIVSVLEYITSYILETRYGFRWWDYGNNPWNINGRICMLNSLMFGVGGYLIAKFISPYINLKLNKRSSKLVTLFSIFIVVTVSTDFVYTLFHPNTGVGITTNEVKIVSDMNK